MLSIRNASAGDVPLILEFIRELAEYEKAPQEAVASGEDLLRDGFSDQPKFRVLLAEWDGQPAGFALYFYNYSTWQGKPGQYLEDLFVRLQFRGRGIGKAILAVAAATRRPRSKRTAAASSGPPRRAGVERAGHRILRVAGSKSAQRVGDHASDRRGPQEAGGPGEALNGCIRGIHRGTDLQYSSYSAPNFCLNTGSS